MADSEGGPAPVLIDPPADTLAELWQSVRRDLNNARVELGHWRGRAEKAETELRILKDTLAVMRERTGALRHEHGVLLDELTNRTMERDGARAQRDALREFALCAWDATRGPAALERCRELGVDI